LKSKKDVKLELPPYDADDPITGLFNITVIEAKNVPKLDVIGHCDPFVKLNFWNGIKFKTSVKTNTAEPRWNESFKIFVLKSQQRYTVEVQLYDYDRNSRNDFAGSAHIDLDSFFNGPKSSADGVISTYLTLPLNNPKKPDRPGYGGILQLRVEFKNRYAVEREFWLGFATHFDFDNSGTIGPPELIAMAQALGSPATDDDINNLFARADRNSDGQLTYEEFTTVMTQDIDSPHKNPIVEKILPEDAFNFIWWAVARDRHVGENDGQSMIGALMLERGFYGKVERKPQDNQIWQIVVCDRETGRLEEELIPDYIRVSLRLMYSYGKFATKINKVLKHMSEQQGKKFTNPISKAEIKPFIHNYNLPIDDILLPLEDFENFNEFFYRKLKAGVRPVAEPNHAVVAVSPADCRMHVFPTVTDATRLWIKGDHFDVVSLISDPSLAEKYKGGSIVIARLAPQDYHRYHR